MPVVGLRGIQAMFVSVATDSTPIYYANNTIRKGDLSLFYGVSPGLPVSVMANLYCNAMDSLHSR